MAGGNDVNLYTFIGGLVVAVIGLIRYIVGRVLDYKKEIRLAELDDSSRPNHLRRGSKDRRS
jgi:hypothetical protein